MEKIRLTKMNIFNIAISLFLLFFIIDMLIGFSASQITTLLGIFFMLFGFVYFIFCIMYLTNKHAGIRLFDILLVVINLLLYPCFTVLFVTIHSV